MSQYKAAWEAAMKENRDLVRERNEARQALDAERERAPKCAHCGKPATCLGRYEGHGPWEWACDDCCGHGNEDGECRPVSDVAEWMTQVQGELDTEWERADGLEQWRLDVLDALMPGSDGSEDIPGMIRALRARVAELENQIEALKEFPAWASENGQAVLLEIETYINLIRTLAKLREAE